MWWWIGGIFVALIIFGMIQQAVQDATKEDAESAQGPDVDEVLSRLNTTGQLTQLVGVTKENGDGSSRQSAIAQLSEGDSVQLRREPRNRYDKNAIAVIGRAGQVGYVRKDMARVLAPLLDRDPDSLKANVWKIRGGDGDKPNYGVTIEISTAVESAA